jgi:glycosyltransferase involved in cell wall biosynthesis
MRKEMISRGLPAEKLHLIPNGVDLELIQTDAPDMRQELHLDGKFVVLFAGLIGVMQGVEVIVDAARLLQEREDVQFLIVGDGIEKTKLMKRVHELGLKNLTFFPKQSQDNLPRFINTANICLATLANREVKGVVPYKMLEAWAYRRPVVLTDDDEAADLIRTCQGGIATPPGDARALADAILQLEADRARARQMGENGRRCIEEKLNREQLARKMESVLLAVTRQAGNAAS